MSWKVLILLLLLSHMLSAVSSESSLLAWQHAIVIFGVVLLCFLNHLSCRVML